MEKLTANEQAYDLGADDYRQGELMLSYEDWYHQGSYSSYKAGWEDAQDEDKYCSED